MGIVIESLKSDYTRLLELSPRLALSIIVVVLAVLIGRLAGSALGRVLKHNTSLKLTRVSLLRRIVTWIAGLFGIVLGLQLMGLTSLATSLLATGGVVAIVFGFAFREIGENLLAGLFLAFGRSFDVGDVIESDSLRGEVKTITLRNVHIRTPDGCDIFIPCASIFRNPLHNFTRDGLRRGSFAIGIDFGDESGSARDLLLRTVADVDGVLAEPKPAVQMSEFAAQYQELTVYFWVNTFDVGQNLVLVRTAAMQSCREALAEAGYTFSSDVTTSVAMAPVDVRVDHAAER